MSAQMAGDLSSEELTAIAKVVTLAKAMAEALSPAEAWPGRIEIHSEVQPGFLGWVDMNDNGDWTFQPASKPEERAS